MKLGYLLNLTLLLSFLVSQVLFLLLDGTLAASFLGFLSFRQVKLNHKHHIRSQWESSHGANSEIRDIRLNTV